MASLLHYFKWPKLVSLVNSQTLRNGLNYFLLVRTADWFLDQFDGLIFDKSIFGDGEKNPCFQTTATTTATTTTTPLLTTSTLDIHNIEAHDFEKSDFLSNDLLFDAG